MLAPVHATAMATRGRESMSTSAGLAAATYSDALQETDVTITFVKRALTHVQIIAAYET